MRRNQGLIWRLGYTLLQGDTTAQHRSVTFRIIQPKKNNSIRCIPPSLKKPYIFGRQQISMRLAGSRVAYFMHSKILVVLWRESRALFFLYGQLLKWHYFVSLQFTKQLNGAHLQQCALTGQFIRYPLLQYWVPDVVE